MVLAMTRRRALTRNEAFWVSKLCWRRVRVGMGGVKMLKHTQRGLSACILEGEVSASLEQGLDDGWN
jgi:hypothetical protein